MKTGIGAGDGYREAPPSQIALNQEPFPPIFLRA